MNTEETLLRAVIERPHDQAARLVYADWLEEHGDPRAEFLRLEVELCEMPERHPNRAQVRERLKSLWQEFDADWLASVNRSPVEGCRFRFKCPKKWPQLQETDNRSVRFCEECRREVFYCKSAEDARYYIGLGFCVAVDAQVERTPGDIGDVVEQDVTLGLLAADEEDRISLGEFEEDPPRKRWWQFWR
jgi:uncharacterized protein (TIGR02996 family)